MVELPVAYETPFTWWNENTKVSYKDGVLSYYFRRYNPDEWQLYYDYRIANDLEFFPNEPILMQKHILIGLADQFDDQDWLEQLAVDAIDVISYFDKKCFRKINGKTPQEVRDWCGVFNIGLSTQLSVNNVSFGSFRTAAVVGGAYRPERFGDRLSDFPINALYMVVGALVLPQMIQALPVLIKTFPEYAEALKKLVTYLVGLTRKLTGVATEWPDWSIS